MHPWCQHSTWPAGQPPPCHRNPQISWLHVQKAQLVLTRLQKHQLGGIQICHPVGTSPRLHHAPEIPTQLAPSPWLQTDSPKWKQHFVPSLLARAQNFLALPTMPHPKQTQLFTQLCRDIATLHAKAQVNPHILQLLWQGLNSVQQQYSVNDLSSHFANAVSTATQHWPGSTLLQSHHHLLGDLHQSPHPNKNQWYHLLHEGHQSDMDLHFILMANRKQALHSPNPTDDFWYQALKPQVAQIFQQIKNDPILQQHSPQYTMEQVMQWPIQSICHFIATSNLKMHDHLRAARRWLN